MTFRIRLGGSNSGGTYSTGLKISFFISRLQPFQSPLLANAITLWTSSSSSSETPERSSSAFSLEASPASPSMHIDARKTLDKEEPMSEAFSNSLRASSYDCSEPSMYARQPRLATALQSPFDASIPYHFLASFRSFSTPTP